MSQEQWTAVDQYFCDLFIPPDAVLEVVLRASDEGGLPPHNVAPNQGKLLMMLAQIHKAQRILEIGTLGGYSTIWLARGLPEGGHLITLEFNPKHAEVAKKNFAHAGLSDRIEIRVGRAANSLAQMEQEGHAPFDLIFIDADKPSNPEYFAWALKFSRPGTLIIADNVVRDGAVLDSESEDANIQGIRQFNQLAASDASISVTAIQTVGSKGYDGFALLLVK